jgi:hypothetical protein
MPLKTSRNIPQLKWSGHGKGTRKGAAGLGGNLPSPSRAPKLRDSCDACAVAKIRCNRRKPTCTRCEKRRLLCEYKATKRAGRPSQASKKSAGKGIRAQYDAQQNGTPHGPVVISTHNPHKTAPSQEDFLSSPGAIELFPEQHMAMYEEPFLNRLLSTDQTTTYLPTTKLLTTSNHEFEEFFASLKPLPELEESRPGVLSHGLNGPHCAEFMIESGVSTTLMSEGMLSISEDAWPEMQIHPGDLASISRPVETGLAASVDLPCCCLIIAQSFLHELVPKTSKTRLEKGKQMSELARSLFPLIRTVIADNQRVVDGMDTILQCPCSQDGYLLTVLSIVIFKALDWYESAAQAALRVAVADGYMSRQSVGTWLVSGEDAGRVAAKMVHGELYRIQRLVNVLSARFNGHRVSGKEGNWPFSMIIFYQLEVDLRWRLRMVSSKLIDIIG